MRFDIVSRVLAPNDLEHDYQISGGVDCNDLLEVLRIRYIYSWNDPAVSQVLPVISAWYNRYLKTLVLDRMEYKFKMVEEVFVVDSLVVERRIQPDEWSKMQIIIGVTFIIICGSMGMVLEDLWLLVSNKPINLFDHTGYEHGIGKNSHAATKLCLVGV